MGSKRSLYMDTAQATEIEELAAATMRTWSSEFEWLLTLGLRGRHMMPRNPTPMETRGERRYFYPGDEIAAELDHLLEELRYDSDASGPSWSLSSMYRCLVGNGIRIERMIVNSLDRALTKLTVSGLEQAAAKPKGLRYMAQAIAIRFTSSALLEMLDAPTQEIQEKWGDAIGGRWHDIINAAMAARQLFEALDDQG